MLIKSNDMITRLYPSSGFPVDRPHLFWPGWLASLLGAPDKPVARLARRVERYDIPTGLTPASSFRATVGRLFTGTNHIV
jgi:hypothetical protein